jgi:hypothetical protein
MNIISLIITDNITSTLIEFSSESPCVMGVYLCTLLLILLHFRKVSTLHPFALLVRKAFGRRWAMSGGGMLLTRGNTINRRHVSPRAILSTTTLTKTKLGSKVKLRGDWQRPAMALALETNIELNCVSTFIPYRAVNTLHLLQKTSQLMLYREIIAVCFLVHTKHINTLCGQNVELLTVKLAVNIVTTGL